MFIRSVLRAFAITDQTIIDLNRRLSQCYMLGNYQEGLSIAEKAYEQSKGIGENSQLHLTACSNLALMYKTAGRYEEAISLYEHAHQNNFNTFGEFHKNTITIKQNIAATYKAMGSPDKAVSILQKIIEVRRGQENTSDLVSALNILSACYRDLGNYSKAKECVKEAIDTVEGRYGKGNIMSVNSLNAMGLILKSNKEYDLAEKYLKE